VYIFFELFFVVHRGCMEEYKRSAYNVLVGKHEENRTLGRHRHR
jgi:hypothetical protein